jgi:hypothetical protein
MFNPRRQRRFVRHGAVVAVLQQRLERSQVIADRMFQVDAVLTPDDLPGEVVRPEFDEAKHEYRLHNRKIPGVTTILGVLDKPALPWWGMTIGVKGVLELLARATGPSRTLGLAGRGVLDAARREAADQAQADGQPRQGRRRQARLGGAQRGGALRQVRRDAEDGELPEEAKPYVRSVADFLTSVPLEHLGSEVMVWSEANWYAGTFDTLGRDAKGRLGLLDYKTSKRAYDSHLLQLCAYEGARRELKLDPVDFVAVVHISDEGVFDPERHWFEVTGKEIARTIEDFHSIKQTYDRMKARELRLKPLHRRMNPKGR